MAQMIVSVENNLTLVKSLSTYKLNDYFTNIGKGMSNSQMPLMDQALCYVTFFFFFNPHNKPMKDIGCLYFSDKEHGQ